MLQLKTIVELREVLSCIHKAGQKIGLVPTMGNIHAGHLSLVEIARQHADKLVVTIFVNPSQFIDGEDFEHYPRTLDRDLEQLQRLDADLVFIPEMQEIYPSGQDLATEVIVPALDSIYCGAFRPGHFKGVATIVTKLFNIIQPDVAVFGEKDYQQLLIIRRLVKDLNIPVRVIGGPIVREASGLAMSSRNQYLTDEEREQAANLYSCLVKIARAIEKGEQDFKRLEDKAMRELTEYGFKSEYVGIRDAATLGSPNGNNIVIIAAARLGKARLIDAVVSQNYNSDLNLRPA